MWASSSKVDHQHFKFLQKLEKIEDKGALPSLKIGIAKYHTK